MIRKHLLSSSLLISFCLTTSHIYAGQLFRFNDESGTPTLSKTLPPKAAQQGYDIIDDKTMRLIERVPPALTEEQLAEQAERQAAEASARQAADAETQKMAEIKRQQSQHDRKLLTIYETESDLLEARNKDLGYRQDKLNVLTKKQPVLKQKLMELQNEAAEKELSGLPVSDNLQKRLAAAEQELSNNQLMIDELEAEILSLSQQYEQDRQRLTELLKIRQR